MLTYRFKQAERLRSPKQIESLFSEGNRFCVPPFKVIWQNNKQSDQNLKLVISVPKKRISKASHRNRVKRLVRESFRKHNYILKEALRVKNKSINLMLIYNLESILTYSNIEHKISVTLQRLSDEV